MAGSLIPNTRIWIGLLFYVNIYVFLLTVQIVCLGTHTHKWIIKFLQKFLTKYLGL